MKNRHTFFLVISLLLVAMNGFSQVIEGTYAIKNVQTGIYLRIKDADTRNGTPIVAYSPVNWKCVTWNFKHLNGQAYQLVNLFSGKTLQPQQSKAVDGIALEEYSIDAKLASQQFEFIPVEKDMYLIRLAGTDLVITPADDKGAINTNILLAKKNNTRLQYWTLQKQDPKI